MGLLQSIFKYISMMSLLYLMCLFKDVGRACISNMNGLTRARKLFEDFLTLSLLVANLINKK